MNYKSYLSYSLFLAVFLSVSGTSQAQDATVVDSAHYSVEFENDEVRVLRIRYEPGEQGVMHSHPAGLAVFLTAGSMLMSFPDGSTDEMNWPAGLTAPLEAVTHQGINTGDDAFEVIQVEFKKAENESGGY